MTDKQIEQIVNGWTQVQKIAVRQMIEMCENSASKENPFIERVSQTIKTLVKVQQLLNKTDEEEG